jgi:hypothetical protein
MVTGNALPSDQGSAESSQSHCAGQGIVSRGCGYGVRIPWRGGKQLGHSRVCRSTSS